MMEARRFGFIQFPYIVTPNDYNLVIKPNDYDLVIKYANTSICTNKSCLLDRICHNSRHGAIVDQPDKHC